MKKIYIVMAVFATVMMASCQQEGSFENSIGENSVVFAIKGGSTTRSAEAISEVTQGVIIPLELETEDGSKYVLQETVVSLNELGPETKGTPAYTENVGILYANDLNVYGDAGSFTTETIYENVDNSGMFPRKGEDEGDGWRYHHNYTSDPWPANNGAVNFYLNMPSAPTNVDITNRAGGKFYFDYTSPQSATEQQDILFAYRSLTKSEHQGYLTNGTPVLFQHALSGVKFAISNPDGGYNDGKTHSISITKVEFTGLVKSGSCVVAPTTENDVYVDDGDIYSSSSTGVVVWDLGDEPETGSFSQTFGSTDFVEYTTGGSFENNGKYPNSFAAAGNTNNVNDKDASKTFWFIPQQMNTGVKLIVSIVIDGKEQDVPIDFGKALGSLTWKAGELRTYTLRIDDVDVTITDTVNETKKESVVIKNNSNVDVFIRAAIVGQWVDENENPVFSFTDFKDGNLVIKPIDSWYQDQFSATGEKKFGTFDGLPGSGWVKGTDDDFYYYTSAVAPNASTGTPLFKSYTVTTANIPNITVGGIPQHVHFVLSISTQAISAKIPYSGDNYDSYADAWAAAEAAGQAE